MKFIKYFFLGFLLLTACTKYESVSLDNSNLKYFPWNKIEYWEYYYNNDWFFLKTPNRLNAFNNFNRLGDIYRNSVLFPGQRSEDRIGFKFSDNKVLLEIVEKVENFNGQLVVSAPYELSFKLGNIKKKDTYAQLKDIKYYLSGQTIEDFTVLFNYTVLNYAESATFNGVSYDEVIVYRIDYSLGNISSFKTFVFAAGIGIVAMSEADDFAYLNDFQLR